MTVFRKKIKNRGEKFLNLTGHIYEQKYSEERTKLLLAANCTMIRINFEVVSIFDVIQWCDQHFGEDWILNESAVFFKHKEHATLFALRWS